MRDFDYELFKRIYNNDLTVTLKQLMYFSKVFEKKAIMEAIIEKKLASALTGSVNLIMLKPGTDAFNEYFKKSSRIVKKYKNEVLAILDDKAFFFLFCAEL